MYSFLNNLIYSKALKKTQLQKLFLLLAFLSLWVYLSWQRVEQLSSNQIQQKPKQEQKQLSNIQNPIIQEILEPTQLALIHLQKNIKEQPLGSNKGDSVSKWSYNVFGKDGVPWCAIYISEIFRITDYYPKIRSARAIAFVTDKSYSIKQVMLGLVIPQRNWLAIKSRPGGNHIDLIDSFNVETKTIFLIGGNVGDKVSYRKVKLNLTDRFGYQFFTPTYKE